MKSRVKRWTQRDQEELCDAVSKDVDYAIGCNGLVNIVAFARHTGWGKKRILDLCETVNKVQEEYAGYSHDGIFDYKLKEEFESIGIDMNTIMPEHIPFKEARRIDEMRKKREAPAYSECLKMQKNLKAVERMLKNDNK